MMNKKKFFLLLYFASYLQPCYATFPQTAELCLYVHDNHSGYGIEAGFRSNETFSFRKHTEQIINGIQCIRHTYNHGPKKIMVQIISSHAYPSYNKINLDPTCNFMHARHPNIIESSYIESNAAVRKWYFEVVQAPPENGYRFNYEMKCFRDE